jgi:opacity protein-like surface antigen
MSRPRWHVWCLPFATKGGRKVYVMNRALNVFAVALMVTLVPIDGRAQEEDRVHFSFGGGFTAPNSEVREQLGGGYNLTFGVDFDLTRALGLEAYFSTNNIGERQFSIPVSLTPAAISVPTDFSANVSMLFGTASLVLRRPGGRFRPYGLVGIGVYERPVELTTSAAGWVSDFCNPWWYICQDDEFVSVDSLVGIRSSTDFGMDVGAGVNIGYTFTEVRYHYVWGPRIAGTDVRANGKFLATSFGVRF